MSPILGIWASQISGHLYTPVGSYDALATVTVPSGGVASVTFAGIPTNYRHLQIRGILQTTNGDTEAKMTFNGDTTSSNYSTHQLLGDGTSANSYAITNSGFIKTGITTQSNSSIFGGFFTDILDYANVSKNKTARSLAGIDANGSGYIRLTSGAWYSTNAVSSITLTPSAGTWNQYTQFALYGIK